MKLKSRIEFINESKSIQFNYDTTGNEEWDMDIEKYADTLTIKFVDMTPDEYLERVNYKSFSTDDSKVEKYVDLLNLDKLNVPVPSMWFSDIYQYEKGFRPAFHDGQHRVQAFKKIGIKVIPVRMIISK